MGYKTTISAVAAVAALAAGGWSMTTADEPETATTVDMQAAPVTEVPSELLDGIRVVDELPDVPGYDRDCGPGEGCSFGPAWTDDTDAAGAHNGCDTRNDVLRMQGRSVEAKPGTNGCKVTGGVLDEPYTGKTVDLGSSKSKVQIDHVFPLARSWDAGAHTWTPERRATFANDLDRNLLAVDGGANQSKSDKGLDEWMPPNAAFACNYAKRYLDVARTYDLAVTTGDARAAETACTA